jgi:hypothetical protein
LNGEPLPIIAEATPACAVEEIAVLPVWVHPVKPLSNPPFVIPLGGGTVTVSETLVLWLLLVAVPVTVTGYVPGGVPAPTVKVSVELPPALTDAGLKTAVVPEGRPLVLNAMLSALPPVIAVEMVEVPVPPCATETLVGFALIEKSFGAVTVRLTVVVCVAVAAVPVTVIGYVPGVVAPTVSVRVELPPAVTDAGLNEAVVPDGRPLALMAMLSALPLVTVVEIVEVAVVFRSADTLLGLALIEKSFRAMTVSETLVV